MPLSLHESKPETISVEFVYAFFRGRGEQVLAVPKCLSCAHVNYKTHVPDRQSWEHMRCNKQVVLNKMAVGGHHCINAGRAATKSDIVITPEHLQKEEVFGSEPNIP